MADGRRFEVYCARLDRGSLLTHELRKGAMVYRIAYVIGELGQGGAEYQLFELLRGLDRRRFAPHVLVLAEGGFWAEPLRRLGIPVEEIPRRRTGDPVRLARLRQALHALEPHLVQTIRWSGNSYGRLAAFGLHIPVVIASERVLAVTRPVWQVVLDRLLDRLTDAYLVNCEAIAEGLVRREGVARRKITVIPNGIDLGATPPFVLDRRPARAAAGFPPERRLVAQVGRLTAQKDYPTFLEAAARVAEKLPDVDFLVIGEGEERARLERLARRPELLGRVRFTGFRRDVPALLAAADVLTLSSTFEGFPNVILEAMACGAVAVATEVGGCPELVRPGETGLLVSARAPDELAAALLQVLGDPGFAQRLAMAARRRVESQFPVEAMVRRTTALYLELLGRRAVSVPLAAAV